MADINDTANISAIRLKDRASDPASSPASGYQYLFTKSGGLYYMDDAGNVVGPLGGGGDQTGGTIWHPDVRPASPDTKDDEFDDASLAGKWSWTNQGNATVTEASDQLTWTLSSDGGAVCNLLKQSAPATPFTVYAKLGTIYDGAAEGGLNLMVGASGKIMSIGMRDGALSVDKWTSATAYSANAATGSAVSQPLIYKIEADGTNVKFSVSFDGRVFVELFSELDATFLGADPSVLGISFENGANPVGFAYWFRVADQGGGYIY